MKTSVGERLRFELAPVKKRGLVAPSQTKLAIDPVDGKEPIDVVISAKTPSQVDDLQRVLRHHLTSMTPAELEAVFVPVIEADRALDKAKLNSQWTRLWSKGVDLITAFAGIVTTVNLANVFATYGLRRPFLPEFEGDGPIFATAMVAVMAGAIIGLRADVVDNCGPFLKTHIGLLGLPALGRLAGFYQNRFVVNADLKVEAAAKDDTNAKAELARVLGSPNGFDSIETPVSIAPVEPSLLRAQCVLSD